MEQSVCTVFATPAEFEEWVKKVKQLSDTENFDAVKEISETDKTAWDNKGCMLSVSEDGKLNLLCSNGNVLCSVDICHSDGRTVTRDESNGALTVKGFKAQNSESTFDVWVGTKQAYKALTAKDWSKRIYIITDYISFLDSLIDEVTKIKNGTTVVEKAKCDKDGNDIVETYYKKTDTVVNATNAAKATADKDGNEISATYRKKADNIVTDDIEDGAITTAKFASDATCPNATNAEKINDIEITNVNSVLKIGEYITIPQKHRIFKGSAKLPLTASDKESDFTSLPISSTLNQYDKLEIVIEDSDGIKYFFQGRLVTERYIEIKPDQWIDFGQDAETKKYMFDRADYLWFKAIYQHTTSNNYLYLSCMWYILHNSDCTVNSDIPFYVTEVYRIIE